MIVTTETVDLAAADTAMRTFVARPAARGRRYPGLVLYSDIFALTPSTRRAIVRFASYGFVVAAPEIYHRFEPAGRAFDFIDDYDLAQAASAKFHTRDFDADLPVVLAYLRAHPAVGDSLHATGFCLGGHLAFRAALSPEIRSSACFYPTGLHTNVLGADASPGTLERCDEIRGDLLVVFGTSDPHVPPEGRRRVDDALRGAAARYLISEYDGAHAFMRDEGPRYDAAESDRAMLQATGFLYQHPSSNSKAYTGGMSDQALPVKPSSSGGEESASNETVVLMAAVAALGGFLFGYDSAVINGAVTAIGAQFHASAGALGLTVSSALVGAAAGALMAGKVGDHYGRLAAMRIAAVLFVISAVGSGLAQVLGILAVFRIIGGVAVGMASVIAPTYIAEISPADVRGRLGSLQQLAIVSGIFLSLLVDYAIAATAGSSQAPWLGGLEAWRWMFIAMVVPAVAYGILSFTIPESPRQLLAKGRIEEAREVLKRVLGERGLAAKITRIRESLESDREPRWSDLRGPALGLLPVVWAGVGLSVFQQFVGINVIFYYSSVLWQAVGFSEKNSLIITVITSVVNVVTTIVAITLIDRWGRRPLLLVGSAGMAVTLGMLAFIFGRAPLDAAGQPHLLGSAGLVALLAANVYVFAFGMSWGPVVWVLLGEKFPNHIRAAALSVAACAQWIANWIISTSFPVLKNVGLGLAYGLYATFAVLSFFFVWRFIAETKGRELEDMSGGPSGGVTLAQAAGPASIV